jgi:hypothetical protein
MVPPVDASAVSAALICVSVLPQGTVTDEVGAVDEAPLDELEALPEEPLEDADPPLEEVDPLLDEVELPPAEP